MIIAVAAATLVSAVTLPCDAAGLSVAPEANRVLVACRASPDVYLVNSRTGRAVAHILPEAPDGVKRNSVAISPDGRAVALAWRDGTVEVWNERAPKAAIRWKASFYTKRLSFTPGNRELVVNDVLLDLKTGQPSGRSFDGDFDAPNDIAYSPKGNVAAVSEADTTVRLFEVPSGKEKARFTDLLVEPFGVGFAPDGKVIVGVADGRILLLTDDLHLIRSYAAPAGIGVLKIFARSRQVLAQLYAIAGGSPPTMMLLDIASGAWSPVPQLKDAVALSQTPAGVIAFWIDGRRLTSREIALPK